MSGKYSKQTKKGPGFFAGLLVGLVTVLTIVAVAHYLPKLLDIKPPKPSTIAQPTDGIEATDAQPTDDTETPMESIEIPGESVAVEQPDASDILIDTPYCTLHYPAQWSQDVKIQTDETPEKFSVTMIGLIGGKEVPLFAVVFGESAEMPIGTLDCGDGKEVSVRLNLDLFIPDEEWTEEETNRAYEMIDGSAYLIEALSELENFQ